MALDLLSIANLSPDDIRAILERARRFKIGARSDTLVGRSVALLFEKPSLRTRVSFDLAVHQLGGHPVYMGRDETGLGTRERVSDVARVLERYVDAIVARVFVHETLLDIAEHASVPVINALSDVEHPCQALADLLTVYELRHKLRGVTVTYVGDGNNVAASLALACASVGVNFVMASPKEYAIAPGVLQVLEWLAGVSGVSIRLLEDPEEAVVDADVVYTDVWTSMGQEEEADRRRKAFAGYAITTALMGKAKPDAVFMHPLPAHYGEEVDPDMQEYPHSAVFQQAENRLHVQKAVLELLMGDLHGHL